MRYQAEKQRIADAVIALLELSLPDIRRGSRGDRRVEPGNDHPLHEQLARQHEGWLLTPGTGYRPLRNTLPGLRHFFMAGSLGHAGAADCRRACSRRGQRYERCAKRIAGPFLGQGTIGPQRAEPVGDA